MRIDIGEIQRMMNENEINDIRWVPSEEQIADIMTKRDVVSKMKVLESVINGTFS